MRAGDRGRGLPAGVGGDVEGDVGRVVVPRPGADERQAAHRRRLRGGEPLVLRVSWEFLVPRELVPLGVPSPPSTVVLVRTVWVPPPASTMVCATPCASPLR